MSVFSLIGGKKQVLATVNQLSDRIMADPANNPCLSALSRAERRQTLYAMLVHLLSGEYHRRGEEALELVARLGLSPQEGRELARHVRNTLTEIGLDPDLIEKILFLADQQFLAAGQAPGDK